MGERYSSDFYGKFLVCTNWSALFFLIVSVLELGFHYYFLLVNWYVWTFSDSNPSLYYGKELAVCTSEI